MITNHETGSEITNNTGENFIVFKRTHPLTNWTIVEYFDADDFYTSILDTKIITIIIVFTSIIFCIFASLFISHRISFPINKMRRKMIEVEKGVFDQEFITNSKDEIGDLARGFNHMLFKIKELIDSVVQETKLKKEAEVTLFNAYIPAPTIEMRGSPIMEQMKDTLSYLSQRVKEQENALQTISR